MVTTYLRRFYSSFGAHVIDIPPRLLVLMIIPLFVVLPILGMPLTILFILTTANVKAVFAASWDLLVGRTGQISLGHALFFGTGAYGTALLFYHYGWELWVTIPFGLLLGVVVAVIIGFPCLRVKREYLALVTLAFPLILLYVILYFREFTGGDFGIWNLPSYFPFLPYRQQYVAEYYFTLLLLLVSAVILYKIANSRTGIVFVSILDDELASKASGIDVTKYKLMAFVISGLFGSLAGSVSAHLTGSVAPTVVLSITLSFMAIVWTTFGGIGTIYGPIAGVYVLEIVDKYILSQLLDVTSSWRLVSYSILVIALIILWRGRGLARFVNDKLTDLQEARNIDERGPRIWKKYRKRKKE